MLKQEKERTKEREREKNPRDLRQRDIRDTNRSDSAEFAYNDVRENEPYVYNDNITINARLLGFFSLSSNRACVLVSKSEKLLNEKVRARSQSSVYARTCIDLRASVRLAFARVAHAFSPSPLSSSSSSCPLLPLLPPSFLLLHERPRARKNYASR